MHACVCFEEFEKRVYSGWGSQAQKDYEVDGEGILANRTSTDHLIDDDWDVVNLHKATLT